MQAKHETNSPLSYVWKYVKEQYKLLHVEGQGGFGVVVKARDRTTKEIVAIKLINCTLDNPMEVRLIIREISILRQLS